MRAPIAFIYGNCVFGRGFEDGWAAFRVQTTTYAWCGEAEKRARLLELVGALEALEADVQILRVSSPWELGRYGREMTAASHAADAQTSARQRYVLEHVRRLGQVGGTQPAVFVLASLREPERDVASYLSRAVSQHPREWLDELRRAFSPRHRRLMTTPELERARSAADAAHARLDGFLRVRPARTVELQWLIRRSFCRGLGEPEVDGLHEPRALAFECNGQAVLAPLEGDVMRWADGLVEQRGRLLRVESELGTSWQAQLVVGALPERCEFPGARAELMFAPVESLPFAVDLSLNARFLPNELALRIARRRIQDADQILRAEADGEQGISDLGYERTQEARDLLAYLQASSRPPLLRATLAIALGASSEQELEQRVETCRRAWGEIRLHRPMGDQLPLFLQHLPAQRTRVEGYDDTLTTEQVAAMMPTATHVAGSRSGFYLGYTLSGSRQPVRFNLNEGSETNRNTAVLCVGALGTGKTTLAQKLKYEGFLLGARVIDCDPKGDHRFHLLEEVAPHVECVTLRPDRSLRGMLDPLRVAPVHLRQDATVSFLRDLLPGRADPAWETALVGAVDRVLTRAGEPSCTEVVRALQEGDQVDTQVGKALEVYARSGLTQLGFADPAVRLPPVGTRRVTYLPIRDLPGPEPGLRRSEYSQSERVGEQIVRLIAMFAMQLMGAERERLKLFSFDEGWRLLGDPVGRTLLSSLQRMGRSEKAVPIISTQLVTDTLVGEHGSIANLLGATFVFGMRSEAEATRALALLDLDPEDRRLRRHLLGFEAGSCLMRDHRGRVEAIQVDLVVPALLQALDHPSPRLSRTAVGLLSVAALMLMALCAAPLATAARSSDRVVAPHAGTARAPGAQRGASLSGSPAPTLAPSGSALSTAPSGEGSEEEAASESVQGSTDPLVGNGLGSPLCRSRGSEAQLSATTRRDCATSGFVASAAPTANYGLDVHIDTGVLGLSHGGLMSALQDLLVTPLWMALVWVVHALCVMLEWCFTLNLLDSPVSGGVGRGLRQMQQALTEPWVPTVLAVACVLVVYDGLVRRRVADTLGQALVMVVMMSLGLWAIADPGGTVGALGSWANEASLGTLAATASATPTGTPQALGQGMQAVFSTAIEVPWCYLEFGDVSWCRDPARTETRLRAAGLKIASEELTQAGCPGYGAGPANNDACGAGATGANRALLQSARLLREADSNGAIFLALPANGPQRNSINDEGSLLRTICQSSDATACRGPAAAEAEFRTASQTWSRLAGLLLIALGALGMILLLGFIALRLLSAALFSLFYLLIAPGMVLAPALGEGGRAVFRRWATHLLGAVISKLLFSFLLGVVLAVLAILASLRALGWWTQWLLMSAFWWGAYMRRHQALGFTEGAVGRRQVPRPHEPRSVARRVTDVLESRKGMAVARWAKRHRDGGPPEARPRSTRSTSMGTLQRAGGKPDASGRRPPDATSSREDSRRGRLAEQLARVRRERAAALSAGNRRRAAELGVRADRVEGELKAEDGRGGPGERPAAGAARGQEREQQTAARSTRADVAPRPPVADRSPRALERRRKARLEIDHEIELHRQRAGRGLDQGAGVAKRSSQPSAPPPTDGSARGSDRGAGARDAGRDPRGRQVEDSSVMRDAREVQARRKRFLGPDRP